VVGDEMDREKYLITIVEDRTTPSLFGIVLGTEILALEQLQFGGQIRNTRPCPEHSGLPWSVHGGMRAQSQWRLLLHEDDTRSWWGR